MAELSKQVALKSNATTAAGTSASSSASRQHIPLDPPATNSNQKAITGLEVGIECTEINDGDMAMAVQDH